MTRADSWSHQNHLSQSPTELRVVKTYLHLLDYSRYARLQVSQVIEHHDFVSLTSQTVKPWIRVAKVIKCSFQGTADRQLTNNSVPLSLK